MTVQVSVNNGITSGCDFSIYEFETGIIVHSFKMHTGTTGREIHEVPLRASVLKGKVLSWQILNCTPIVTDSCHLDVEVFQDGIRCPMNKDAHYELKKVPGCSINQAMPVKGRLYFVYQFSLQGV